MKRLTYSIGSIAMACSIALGSISVSSASHQSSAPKAPKLKKGVTLTVWDYFCNTGQTTCAERDTEWGVIKQWEAISHDTVKFPTNPSNHDGTMCTAGPAGQGPDVVAGPHNEMAPMVSCKTLEPIPTWAWPASARKGYIKAATQAVTIDGKAYSMPWAIETTGLFYNKKYLSAKDFKPAKGNKYFTWAQLIAKFKKLNLSGALPFGWDQANFYFDYAFISGNGGYVFKFTKKGYDWHTIGLDTAGAIKGISFILSLNDNGKYKLYPASMNDSTASGLFNEGKLAAYYTGPWNEAAFQKSNINFGFEALPSFDGKHPSRPFSGVQVYALNRFSKHPNEAASLLAYLTAHMQKPEFHTSGRIPVITSILKSSTLQKDPIAGGLAKAALAASPMPNIAEMAQVWTPMGNAIQSVVLGKSSPASAARAAVAQIKSAIAKAHGG